MLINTFHSRFLVGNTNLQFKQKLYIGISNDPSVTLMKKILFKLLPKFLNLYTSIYGNISFM